MSMSFRKHLTCPTYDAVRKLNELSHREGHSGDAVLRIIPEHKVMQYLDKPNDPHVPELAKLLRRYVWVYRNQEQIKNKIGEILARRAA